MQPEGAESGEFRFPGRGKGSVGNGLCLTQAEVAPPTFVFFVSDADRVSETYARYLDRSLRKIFRIEHAPIRVRLRSSHKKKSE